MKSKIVFLLLFVLSATNCRADYASPELFDLVGASDLIVIGTVDIFNEDTFILEISEVLVGSYDKSRIEVHKFQDWECSQRWSPYSKGQSVVAFLEKTDEVSNITQENLYKLRSAGSEGEFPIENENVYVHGIPIKNIPVERYGRISAQKISLESMRSAIKSYQNCFQLTRGQERWPLFEKVEQICSDAELIKYENLSRVHKHLSDSTKIRKP